MRRKGTGFKPKPVDACERHLATRRIHQLTMRAAEEPDLMTGLALRGALLRYRSRGLLRSGNRGLLRYRRRGLLRYRMRGWLGSGHTDVIRYRNSFVRC